MVNVGYNVYHGQRAGENVIFCHFETIRHIANHKIQQRFVFYQPIIWYTECYRFYIWYAPKDFANTFLNTQIGINVPKTHLFF